MMQSKIIILNEKPLIILDVSTFERVTVYTFFSWICDLYKNALYLFNIWTDTRYYQF
jgi:hypothetical protein